MVGHSCRTPGNSGNEPSSPLKSCSSRHTYSLQTVLRLLEQMEYCQCSRPDLWDTGDSRCCIGCGLVAAPDTKVSRKRKAKEAEIDTNDNERVAPQPSSRTTFSYKKLSHPFAFRLLRLFPGNHRDDLACEIFHSDISDHPDYEAVSYTWGNTALTQELHTTAGLIYITENCVSALTGLRDVTQERILWVDAVCIDQVDNEEKNHQIPLMTRIYAGATKVLIYLGSQANMKDMEALFELLRRDRQVPPDGNCQADMTNFLSLPWFSRIWILQEVAMADDAKIIVGSASLDWRHLSIANIHTLGLKATNLAGQVPAVLKISRSDKRPLRDLASLITVARSCLSTDPRDRIYALLGLTHGACGIDLVPDYTRSTKEIYTDVAIQFLKASNSLDFLSEIGSYEKFSQADLDQKFSQADFDLSTSFEFSRRDLHHIQELQIELQKATSVLDRFLSDSMNKYGPDFLIPIPLPKSDLEELLLNLKAMVNIRTEALVNGLEAFSVIVSEHQASLDLFIDIGEELEKICSREIDRHWLYEATEACKSWGKRLQSAQATSLNSKDGIDAAMLQSHGTFLTPRYLFGQIPIQQASLDITDEHLDLPSWVPDYRHHPRLFSFTRWRPNLFAGNLVARFDTCSPNYHTPSLEVKAIFVNKVQNTDCLPEQYIRLCDESIQFLWDWKADSTNFAREFGQSVNKTGHGATLDDICKFSQGRRLALTEKSLAILPASFELGDVIAVLYGGTVPYLLRPSISSPYRFKLLGECYLHGIKGPQFAPDYAELLGYFKDHIGLGAGDTELLKPRDGFLEESEKFSEIKAGLQEIERGVKERRSHVTEGVDVRNDELPWQTIFLM